MNRRDLIKQVALLSGGAVIGAEFFLTGCRAKITPANLSSANLALLDEIADTIIPTTADSGGAKVAKVAEFMKKYISDCYTSKQQDAFMNGISSIQNACKKTNSKAFEACTNAEKISFLTNLGKEAIAYNKKVNEENEVAKKQHEKENEKKEWKHKVAFEGKPNHYFTMMRQLTILGYFTSKEGVTKALRHNAVPGKYDGNVTYIKGEKAWA